MITVQVLVFLDGALVAEGQADGEGPETVDLFIAAVVRAQNELIARNQGREHDDER